MLLLYLDGSVLLGLSAGLWDDGVKQVTSIDFSVSAINFQKATCASRKELKFEALSLK